VQTVDEHCLKIQLDSSVVSKKSVILLAFLKIFP